MIKQDVPPSRTASSFTAPSLQLGGVFRAREQCSYRQAQPGAVKGQSQEGLKLGEDRLRQSQLLVVGARVVVANTFFILISRQLPSPREGGFPGRAVVYSLTEKFAGLILL